MNIWIIDHYSSEPAYGGITRQYDFAKELGDRGHTVLVIASAFSHFTHEYISRESCLCQEISENVHYAYLRTVSYSDNASYKRILNMFSFVQVVGANCDHLMKKYGRPDVVVGCSIHPFTWIAAYRTARRYGARFYAEVRDLWPATWIYNRGMSPHHPKALFFGFIEKMTYKRAEKIIYSMSRGDKYICDILGFPREKTVWIDQPMDCERFDANAKRYGELPQDIIDFIGNAFLCVFTGYYIDYEGVFEMLEAAKLLKDEGLPVKFVFVGSGEAKDGMDAYAAEHELTNVYIGGRISKELIPALLRRADVCLAHLAVRGNPNSYPFDASKNKINEYMYADACIIYGTCLKDHFVNTSGVGFTITPYSAVEFAKTIKDVYMMSPDVRAEFGKNGTEYIRNHNTVSRLIDKYLESIGG